MTLAADWKAMKATYETNAGKKKPGAGMFARASGLEPVLIAFDAAIASQDIAKAEAQMQKFGVVGAEYIKVLVSEKARETDLAVKTELQRLTDGIGTLSSRATNAHAALARSFFDLNSVNGKKLFSGLEKMTWHTNAQVKKWINTSAMTLNPVTGVKDPALVAAQSNVKQAAVQFDAVAKKIQAYKGKKITKAEFEQKLQPLLDQLSDIFRMSDTGFMNSLVVAGGNKIEVFKRDLAKMPAGVAKGNSQSKLAEYQLFFTSLGPINIANQLALNNEIGVAQNALIDWVHDQ